GLAGLGRNREAELAINQALALNPREPDMLTLKAFIVDALGRHGESRQLLRQAKSIDPNHDVASEVLGEMRKQDTAKAVRVTGGILGIIFDVFGEFLREIFRGL